MPTYSPEDERYYRIIQQAISVCAGYKPKFGKGSSGLSLDEFRALYGQDSFYSWFGLDSPLIYAAHRAAGGMTSVYRQVGIACERLARQLFRDQLLLSESDISWHYTVPSGKGKPRKLSLDARIPLAEVQNSIANGRIKRWLNEAAQAAAIPSRTRKNLVGAVFEVRQGYKSKDAKRQNADLANAANAYANLYLPVVIVLSNQIDDVIAERYRRAQWVILKGTPQGTAWDSTYAFFREVLDYDLAGFFQRNAKRIRKEINAVTEALLQ